MMRWMRRSTAALRIAVPVLVTVGITAAAVGASTNGDARVAQSVAPGAAPTGQQPPALERFEASGLPAGPAIGNPVHTTFPAGTNLKHIHGGPTFVYVIAGTAMITEADGTTVTYGPGSFFWEPPGHVHTIFVPQMVEVFFIQFLPPGAEATVPVQ